MLNIKSIGVGEIHGLSSRELDSDVVTEALSREAILSTRQLEAWELDIPERNVRLIVEGIDPRNEWIRSVAISAADLLRLQNGWDSYGSPQIYPHIVASSLRLLAIIMQNRSPSPAVIPRSDGNIQLEWHCYDIDLEVIVKSPIRYDVYYEDSVDNDEWEAEVKIENLARLKFSIDKINTRCISAMEA